MVRETLTASLEGLAARLGTVTAGATERVLSAVPGTGAAGAVMEQVGAALADVGEQVKRPERLAKAAEVLFAAGVITPMRPDQAVEAVRALYGWQMTPATGFTVSALRYPDQPAVVDEIGTLTYEEVHKRTNALANALREKGIEEDDGVAIMCRDHRWWVETTVAVSKLGATALFFNTQFAGPQLAEVIEREEPAAIVHDQEFAEALNESDADIERWVAWYDEGEYPGGTTVEELIEEGDDSEVPKPDSLGRTVLLTSGSTGTPKGASRGQPDPIDPIVALLSRIPLRAREATVYAAPLFHAWGFLNFQLGMLLSSTYVLRRRFDPEETLKAIDQNDATALVIVPIMMQRILELDDEEREKHDASSLRVVAASGGAMSPDISEPWMDEFGENIYNLYGSTEVAWAAIADPKDLRAAPGTSGPPPPGTSLKILDEDQNEQPSGESGEIYVGNEMLFEGYTGGSTEEMVDGHMATGDLGYLDDEGRLFVEGRADNMIVSGGENVYPEEVEETLEGHDNVAEAAVIGVDDEEFGQRLKAFVVKDGEVSEDDLKSHVKEQLAKFKVPREVEFIDEMPRKPQGKVDKGQLEEQHEEQEEGEDSDGSGDSDDESGDGDES